MEGSKALVFVSDSASKVAWVFGPGKFSAMRDLSGAWRSPSPACTVGDLYADYHEPPEAEATALLTEARAVIVREDGTSYYARERVAALGIPITRGLFKELVRCPLGPVLAGLRAAAARRAEATLASVTDAVRYEEESAKLEAFAAIQLAKWKGWPREWRV